MCLASRLLVAVVAVVGAALLHVGGAADAPSLDSPTLTHPFGAGGLAGLAGRALSPLARWDAVWYLRIAHGGYGRGPEAGPQAAFFPLYPALVRLLGGGSTSPPLLLVGSYAVAWATFLVALYLLHRLVTLELGGRAATATLVLLAFFPAAWFFGAPYSESLFLMASVGAFYAARTGRWAWAGALAAVASATRLLGVALLVPLAILYLYGPRTDRPPDGENGRRPRYALRADALWVLLAPAGTLAFAAYLALRYGDGLGFLHLQQARAHALAVPFAAVWKGAQAAGNAVSSTLDGSIAGPYLGSLAARNLMQFGFLIFAALATAGALRRLPLAYGAYVLAYLAIPLSFPIAERPLDSLHRYLTVLFPLFMWMAIVCLRRGWTRAVTAASAVGLIALTALFATWHLLY